ncbi:MAG TPA: hypothetical protein VGG62_02460 [Terracidiphilus sp.]|jgi:hypothetical protein
MKFQTLFHRAERPVRVAVALLSTALAVILLGAAWFQPAPTETAMRAHPHRTVVNEHFHPHIQRCIVTGLVQIIERAI